MNPRRVRHASSRGRDLRDLRDEQRPRRGRALRVVVFDVGERDVVVRAAHARHGGQHKAMREREVADLVRLEELGGGVGHGWCLSGG